MVYQKTEHGVLYFGDCMEIIPTLADKSVDCIITDPPYGILTSKIETKIDINCFAEMSYKLLKDVSYYVFFSQMPALLKWSSAALDNKFKYVDHVVWVKRNISSPFHPLSRTHESLIIMGKKATSKQYNQVKGDFTDIAREKIYWGFMNVDSLLRRIGFLTNGQVHVYKSVKGKNKEVGHMATLPTGEQDMTSKELNYTNVWSFLPFNCSNRAKNGSEDLKGYQHPSVKPIATYMRAMELCSKEGDLICDPFAGTGTAAIAAIKTKRKYIIIEKDEGFCEMCAKRIESEMQQREIAL